MMRKFRNQVGNDTDFGVIPLNTIQSEMRRYGTAKCGEIAPSMQCKCDEDGDGNNDYAIPLMETANTGAWIPAYTNPLTPFQEAVINQICCANVCPEDQVIGDGDDTDLGLDFGPSVMPTSGDGFTPIGSGSGSGFGFVKPLPRPVKPMRPAMKMPRRRSTMPMSAPARRRANRGLGARSFQSRFGRRLPSTQSSARKPRGLFGISFGGLKIR